MEGVLLVKAVAAFIIVMLLMLAFSWILKRTGVAGNLAAIRSSNRLKIVEFLPIDHSRKLVMIKRDDKEHLLLLSSNGETVVESNIKAPNNANSTNKTKSKEG